MRRVLFRSGWIVLFLLGQVVPVRGGDSGSQQQSRRVQARLAVRRVGAVRSLVARSQPDRLLKLNDQTIADCLDSLLNAVPLSSGVVQTPSLEDCRAQLAKSFDRKFDELVPMVARAQGADDPIALEKWLKEYCDTLQPGQRVTLRAQAHKQFNEYLTRQMGRLRALHRHAVSQIVRRQLEGVYKALADDQQRAGIFPTRLDIERVYFNETPHAALVHKVRCRLKATLSRVRLVSDADQELGDIAHDIVASGKSQLAGQLDRLKRAPTAQTPPGKWRELQGRINEFIAGQNGLRLRGFPAKVYDRFHRVGQRIDQIVLASFDQQIAAAASQEMNIVKQGQRRLAPEIVEHCRTQIKSSKRHAATAESMKRFEDVIVHQVDYAAGRLASAVKEKAVRSATRFDWRADLEELPNAVLQRLRSKTSACPREWESLATAVRNDVQEQLRQIRNELAEEQVPLVSRIDQWVPAERLLVAVRPTIDRQWLRERPLWKTETVPADNELLEETWALLIGQAKQVVVLGKAAMLEQSQVVKEARDVMRPQIAAEPDKGIAYWVKRYTSYVGLQWSRASTPSATRFGDLFPSIQRQIKGAVLEELKTIVKDVQASLVAKHRPAIEANIGEVVRKGQSPTFTPHYSDFLRLVGDDWAKSPLSKDHPLLDATKTLMRGIVQQLVDAQVRLPSKHSAGNPIGILPTPANSQPHLPRNTTPQNATRTIRRSEGENDSPVTLSAPRPPDLTERSRDLVPPLVDSIEAASTTTDASGRQRNDIGGLFWFAVLLCILAGLLVTAVILVRVFFRRFPEEGSLSDEGKTLDDVDPTFLGQFWLLRKTIALWRIVTLLPRVGALEQQAKLLELLVRVKDAYGDNTEKQLVALCELAPKGLPGAPNYIAASPRSVQSVEKANAFL